MHAATFNWQLMQSDLTKEMQKVTWEWHTEDAWRKWGCNGMYNADLKGSVDLKSVKFNPKQDGGTEVLATLDNGDLYKVEGVYRGASSLCFTVGISSHILLSDIKIVADVTQVGTEEVPQVKVVVRKTEIGRLSFGSHNSEWVNRLLTGWVNRGLSHMWQSTLGNYINQKLSENLSRYLNEP